MQFINIFLTAYQSLQVRIDVYLLHVLYIYNKKILLISQ